LFSTVIGFVLYQIKPSWVTKPNINGDKYDWYNLIFLSLLGGLTLSLIILDIFLYTPTNKNISSTIKKIATKSTKSKTSDKSFTTEASSIF